MPGRARAHQRRDLRDRRRSPRPPRGTGARAGEQRADGLLDPRAGAVEQPHERHPLGQRQLAQAGDLDLAGHPHRAGHHGEVVGGDGDEPPVDLAVAGDHAVGRRLLALQPAHRVVDPRVEAQLGERPVVDQQRDALARGQLVLRVLAGDPLLAAAQARGRAAALEVLDERAQDRRGGVGSQCSRVADHGAAVDDRRHEAGELRIDESGDLGADESRVGTDVSASSARRPSELRPPGAGNCAGSTDGSSTSRSRWTKTSRRRSRRPARGVRSRTTPRRSSAIALVARRRRARRTMMHAAGGRTPRRRRPASHRPQAPARHMPPRKPLSSSSGVLKSRVRVEPQHEHARAGGARRSATSSARSSSRRRSAAAASRRSARRRSGRPPRAGSRASRAGRPVAGRCATAHRSTTGPAGRPLAELQGQRRVASPRRRAVGGPVTAVATQRSCGHRPVHCGSRFSKNALDALADVLGRRTRASAATRR